MKMDRGGTARFVACSALALLMATGVAAQAQTEEAKSAEAKAGAEAYQTFYLKSVSQQNDANDVQSALRNTLPRARVYFVSFQNALVVRGNAEDLAMAQKLIADLDRPRKIYRLTYTITETDGGKRTWVQHLSLVVVSGSKAVLKQGNRVPLVTGNLPAGNAESGNSSQSPQVQYVDVGENIEASLEGAPEGLRLRTKVEQSSVADEKSGVGAQDPVIRQTALEVYTAVVADKPLVLGSFDVPGGTLHREVEVVAEPLH
jgi:type II secretory pathway component GspD/PulD (secretin)